MFDDVAAQLGDKLVYLRQPNLGGAGGFSRGLYEVSSIADHANVILMDDDILCEPETVLRLNAFANLTPTPTIVGAQMLYLKNTSELHVSAEQTQLTRLRAGRWAANGSPQIGHDQIPAAQARRRRIQRVVVVSDPVGGDRRHRTSGADVLPVGRHRIRAARRDAGFPTVTLPNAGVWHADFDWKDRDEFFRYFSVRNSLITHALHGTIDTKATGRWLAREITEALVSMQYGMAYTMIRGIEDFLAGPEVLQDGGPAALTAIREERAEFAETVVHRRSKIGELTHPIPRIHPRGHLPRKDRINLVLAKRFLFQWLGRTIPGPVAIAAEDNQWWHVSMFDHAVVTDASQSGVRVRRRDKQKLSKLTRRMTKALRRFRTEAPALQDQYRRALPELVSRENWARLVRQLISADARRPVRCCRCRPDTRTCARSRSTNSVQARNSCCCQPG